MMIKRAVINVMICFFLTLQVSCIPKNRDATGEEVSVGVFAGALIGQAIIVSTPATLAGALLGTIFGVTVLEFSTEEVTDLVNIVENPNLTNELKIQKDAAIYSIVPQEKTTTYKIVPINTSATKKDRDIVWCRNTTIKRTEGTEIKTISVEICRDRERWFIQGI